MMLRRDWDGPVDGGPLCILADIKVNWIGLDFFLVSDIEILALHSPRY
jgi:hypothetical protein